MVLYFEESTCRCFSHKVCMMKCVDNSSTMVSLRECVLSLCPIRNGSEIWIDRSESSMLILCFLTLEYFIQQVGVGQFVYVVSRKSLLLFTLDRNKARVSRLPPVYKLRDETPRQIQ
jgi:hypothetical protein